MCAVTGPFLSVAAAALLLPCLLQTMMPIVSCENPVVAFAATPGALKFIRGGHSKHNSVLFSNADSAISPPKAVSALPGTSEVEEQPIRNPIDETCHVLVVGGTRGIGLEFVRHCAERGATVVATHRGDHVPKPLSQLIGSGGGKVSALQMDVSDETSVAHAADELKTRENFKPLTHVVHNAGVYFVGSTFDGTPRGGRASSPPVTKNVMMDTFLTNAVGALLVAQAFVPLMGMRGSDSSALTATEQTRLPVLAVLSSKVGSVDDNGSGGAYAYRASKSALNNICKSLSIDLAGEVSVVLLHPGYVRTDMTNGNGLVDADESVAGMLRAIESTDATTGFRFVDYKACLIPW